MDADEVEPEHCFGAVCSPQAALFDEEDSESSEMLSHQQKLESRAVYFVASALSQPRDYAWRGRLAGPGSAPPRDLLVPALKAASRSQRWLTAPCHRDDLTSPAAWRRIVRRIRRRCEGCQGFGALRLYSDPARQRFNSPCPAAAAARHGLQHHALAGLKGFEKRPRLLERQGLGRTPKHGHASLFGKCPRAHFVAEELENLRTRPNEPDAGRLAAASELGVLLRHRTRDGWVEPRTLATRYAVHFRGMPSSLARGLRLVAVACGRSASSLNRGPVRPASAAPGQSDRDLAPVSA